MMDNPAANKSLIPCQAWAGQHGWPAAPSEGTLLNALAGPQHLGLGSSPQQRHYSSCMSDHLLPHTGLYKAPDLSGLSSSISLFTNPAIPSTSRTFAQQSPHTPSLPPVTAHQGKQPPHPSGPQLAPLPPSSSDHYKGSFQLPLPAQTLVDPPGVLPPCTQNAASSSAPQQPQWIPSSHCRGSVNKSVPEAAVPPNKELSQSKDLRPPINNGRQRSLLLHHRTQLLKQLAETETLLESLPPDDSRDEASPHTAAALQEDRLSDGCSSPSVYEEQRETSAQLGDQMSASDMEGSDKSSAESNCDPYYLPDSDSNTTGFKFETYCSSDENSPSSPSTPSDSRPVAPKRKGPKTRSSCKDTGVIPPKKILSTETVVLPPLSSKSKRIYDKRNYCLFCLKPVLKMSRHLERTHSDKAEVAAAFQYPKNSRERQKIWNKLTNQGNFAHNKDVIKSGKGQLVVKKRPKQAVQGVNFIHCLHCHGLFMKKSLYRHMRKCPEKKNDSERRMGRNRIASRCALEAVGDLGVSDSVRTIVSEMVYDDVTRAVINDSVILQYAEQLFNRYGSNVKKHDYIRQNLRQIARLVLEAQKNTPMQKLEDFFYPANFPYVVSAVNVLAGYDSSNKTYGVPSLALKLGYNLQKTCSIVEGNALVNGNAKLAQSARKFLSEYQKNWTKLISSSALSSLKDARSITDRQIPIAEDVKRLHFHMENSHTLAEKRFRDCCSAESYTALVRVTLARVIVFNRRRPREISMMTMKHFMSRKMSSVLDDMDDSVSHLERTMCGFFMRMDMRGTSGRMVPVLLKPSFVSALELLVDRRDECGIPGDNPFLFARPTALSPYNGSECIRRFANSCGAKNPDALTSRNIRKYSTTTLQLMNLDENMASKILDSNHGGQTVRDNSYARVEEESGVRLEPGGEQTASWDDNQLSMDTCVFYQQQPHGATTSSNMTASSTSAQPEGQACYYKPKQKWTEAEVAAVERHLMCFIQDHKVPQKNHCIQCLEAEAEALRGRSWKGVKDYVRNRITTLKRQSSSSQELWKNRYQPEEVEDGRFQQL